MKMVQRTYQKMEHMDVLPEIHHHATSTNGKYHCIA